MGSGRCERTGRGGPQPYQLADLMTKLLDFVPPPWLRRRLERALMETLGRPWDRWRNVVNNRVRYVDPEGAPMEWVDWLLGLFGFEHIQGLSGRRKRNLLSVAMRIWRDKWRDAGIVFYLRALTGIPSEIVAVNVAAFIAGVSVAGDVCGPGTTAYRFELRRPDGVMDDERLRRRLRVVVPAFSEYRICDVAGENCSDWEEA